MDTITQLTLAFIILIEVGGAFRILKLLIDIMGDSDAASMYFKKIRNVIIFMILSILIVSLKEIIVKYYEIPIL